MSNFLNFLNTADADTLTKVSGITNSIAENIIAARPFESVEDCLNVKGMGKTLLARLQSAAEEQAPEAEANLPVVSEALSALVEKTPPAQENVEEQESFLTRLGRAFINFLRALLKLILISALIVSVGAALYYGLPYIQRTFIAPVEQNTAEIKDLETEIAALQTQLSEMKTRVDALETSVEAHTLSIQKLEGMQTALETQLQNGSDAVLLELKHEVMFTRVLDVLARARLYLAQSNFGLAKADVQTARDLLAELNAEKNDAIFTQAISRLDLALGNLPDFPVVASGDLEIAWQILMSGDVPPTPTPVPPTATPEPTLEVTPTATP